VVRVGLLLLGLVTGFAGAVLHQSWGWLAVTAVAGAATMVAIPVRARLWWAGGFAAVPLALSWPRGEGDVVLTGTPSLVLACLAALWLGIGVVGALPPPRPRTGTVSTPADESASAPPSS
jgi:hypothetical protein